MIVAVDASVAVKWVVEEEGTPEALGIRARAKLIAPDLLVAECANILWKKVARRELLKNEAVLAAALLERADVELVPMRSYLAAATQLAVELDHPAYDCIYLAVAIDRNCKMVTADERFRRKAGEARRNAIRGRVVSLKQTSSL